MVVSLEELTLMELMSMGAGTMEQTQTGYTSKTLGGYSPGYPLGAL